MAMTDRILALLLLLIVLGTPIGVAFNFTGDILLYFVFLYPLFMSVLWITGGIYFWFHWERHWKWGDEQAVPELKGNPLVSILVPCFNEGNNIEETLQFALTQHYPNTEVIAINDGSSDNTGAVLEEMATRYPNLRVVHLAQNQGKAVALRMGATAANSEYLVCIDGDAVLDRNAVSYLVAPLIEHPRLGAVTGNPRIRTRSTLTGRVQVGEFSSIIGLIKRTQRVLGRIFTVSGVVVAFRRAALHRVGYWSPDIMTEDIDISWKLQRDHWSVFYEPRALCWILMPESLKGLWKQRLRWAQGGGEVFLKNFSIITYTRYRYMWPLWLEFCFSTLWGFTFLITLLLWATGTVVDLPPNLRVTHIVPPSFTGLLLAFVCLLQCGTSIMIERRYERKLGRELFWVIWYPLVFWALSLLTSVVSFSKVMLSPRGRRARWVTTDRGVDRQDKGESA
ncbi:glycosyltransferase [Zymobacter palmae]|uniref:Poly-beta-1,6-N-acetyl-D-glucosamine synthase n=2 Tax=Zymobacter palmae TaxID=33074 RepID=A0A348HH81_9GAMM|nr:glycosyltransferase [Zymobacter palmae]